MTYSEIATQVLQDSGFSTVYDSIDKYISLFTNIFQKYDYTTLVDGLYEFLDQVHTNKIAVDKLIDKKAFLKSQLVKYAKPKLSEEHWLAEENRDRQEFMSWVSEVFASLHQDPVYKYRTYEQLDYVVEQYRVNNYGSLLEESQKLGCSIHHLCEERGLYYGMLVK